MGLLITLLLITFNVYGSISSTLAPPKRGFSFIEVWMAAILFIMSFAILEYCFILVLVRMNHQHNMMKKPLFAATTDKIAKIDLVSFVLSLIISHALLYFTYSKVGDSSEISIYSLNYNI